MGTVWAAWSTRPATRGTSPPTWRTSLPTSSALGPRPAPEDPRRPRRIHHRRGRSCHDGGPMDVEPGLDNALRAGADRVAERARSPDARRKLAEHERRIYLPLVLSALLPIVVAVSRAAEDSRVSIVVNVV